MSKNTPKFWQNLLKSNKRELFAGAGDWERRVDLLTLLNPDHWQSGTKITDRTGA